MAAKQAISTALQRTAIQSNPTNHAPPTPSDLVRRASSKRRSPPRILFFDKSYDLQLGNYAGFVHALKEHNAELKLKERPLTREECDAALDRMYETWLKGCEETAQEQTLRNWSDGLLRFREESGVYWESGGGGGRKGKGKGKSNQ